MHERVAAIDVAKARRRCAPGCPAPVRPGARRSGSGRSWRRKAIRALAVRLMADGVELVVMESTSDYWRIWFYVLEGAGLAVQLVNAAQARNLPGRPKTDKLDAMWLARLTEMGMLRPSFVPPAGDPGAAGLHPDADCTWSATGPGCWQRLEKLLEGALIKLSSVASTLATVQSAAGHDRGDDRRRARPAGPGRPWPAPG